jgi:hypothetical protein
MTWITTKVGRSDFHIIPLDDLREHDECKSCWCNPTLDTDCAEVVIHNAMDQRESYEEGRALQ